MRITLAGALVAVALLVGCTGSGDDSQAPRPAPTAGPFAGLSAVQVWQRAESTALAARSVHVVGDQTYSGAPLRLDLRYAGTAARPLATGTITLDGHRLTLLRSGRTAWFRAGRDFWTEYADKTTADLYTNTWMKISQGTDAFSAFFDVTRMEFATSLLTRSPEQQKELVLVGGIPVDRRGTVGLADTRPGKETEESSVLYVAASGPMLPLSLRYGRTDKQSLTYSDWNTQVTVTPPKTAVDLD